MGRGAVEHGAKIGPPRGERIEPLLERPCARGLAERDREQVVKPRAPAEMGLDRGGAQPQERLLGDVGRDERIAVAVAAHPGAEHQERGHGERMAGVRRGESTPERLVHLRHCFPEPRHDRQSALHLVEHRRPRGLEELRFPEDGQFAPQVAFVAGPLAGQEVVPVEGLQALTHAAQLGA
ncbi:MAG: hypothetical protein EBS56_09075, partial [Planctomycetia bacterium]|nr:hypothetical protein [Planctomycetia bacterium]